MTEKAKKRGSVLIVEDDQNNLLTLSALLEDEQFDVQTAESLRGARDILSTAPPFSTVLLDHGLGDGDGTELIPEIRRTHPSAKIFVLTGDPTRKSPSADGVLIKGIAFEDLVDRITRA